MLLGLAFVNQPRGCTIMLYLRSIWYVLVSEQNNTRILLRKMRYFIIYKVKESVLHRRDAKRVQ